MGIRGRTGPCEQGPSTDYSSEYGVEGLSTDYCSEDGEQDQSTGYFSEIGEDDAGARMVYDLGPHNLARANKQGRQLRMQTLCNQIWILKIK